MPVYLLLIILLVLLIFIVYANKRARAKYKKDLFSLPQLGLITLGSLSLLGYLVASNLKELNISTVYMLLGGSIVLGSISACLGFRKRDTLTGVLGVVVTAVVIPAGALAVYGLGRTVIFIAPALGVFLAFKTIFSRRK